MAAPPRGLPAAGPGNIPNGYTPEEGLLQTKSGRNSSASQLCAALDFVAGFIQGKGLNYAVMEDWPLP